MDRVALVTAPLDRLRALLEAATPGPWTAPWSLGRRDYIYAPGVNGPTVAVCARGDAHMVAVLRSVAPELLAVVEAARLWTRVDCAETEEVASGALLDTIATLDAAINAHLPAEPSGSDVPDTVAAAARGASDRQQGAAENVVRAVLMNQAMAAEPEASGG